MSRVYTCVVAQELLTGGLQHIMMEFLIWSLQGMNTRAPIIKYRSTPMRTNIRVEPCMVECLLEPVRFLSFPLLVLVLLGTRLQNQPNPLKRVASTSL